jgi:hypothetical protein
MAANGFFKVGGRACWVASVGGGRMMQVRDGSQPNATWEMFLRAADAKTSNDRGRRHHHEALAALTCCLWFFSFSLWRVSFALHLPYKQGNKSVHWLAIVLA